VAAECNLVARYGPPVLGVAIMYRSVKLRL